MNREDIRHHLRRWDPAGDREAPSKEMLAAIRDGLDARPSPPSHLPTPLGGRWAIAAAAAAVLVAVVLVRHQPRRLTDAPYAASGTEPTQVIYTASNGVRIYWSVPAATTSDK